MFIGAINSEVRVFLAKIGDKFKGRRVIVGCSGNFTSEATLTQHADVAEIHSNDVSFYSALIGAWLTDKSLAFSVVDEDYEFIKQHFLSEAHRVACILVLLDMLEFDKRNNAHRERMWAIYRQNYHDLVEKTVEKLSKARGGIRITSFFAGDVFEHFKHFEGQDAIYCCYAPTYKGGYERLYKRLNEIITWQAPTYEILDDDRRGQLLAWMSERDFLWYDDRRLPGYTPIMEQRSGRAKTVYLYSNVVTEPFFINSTKSVDVPNWLLISEATLVSEKTSVQLVRIKTTELTPFKNNFLGKNVNFGSGTWAFAVVLGKEVAGFVEFSPGKFDRHTIYLMCDFPIPTSRYKRLSKLMAMLAISGETKRLLQKTAFKRFTQVATTAFTDRPVSMKYRGVMKLAKRGETKEGQKFLNYQAEFNNLTWLETLKKWTKKQAKHIKQLNN